MYTIAIANQKGGVGKTTLAVSLAAELADRGRRVLLVDLDAQANATRWARGAPLADDQAEVSDALRGDFALAEIIEPSPMGFDLAPSGQDLASLPVAFARMKHGGIGVLRKSLEATRMRSNPSYDFTLLDCPPSMGSVVLGALAASDGVVIPIQIEPFSLQGLSQFLKAVRDVKKSVNPALQILGVFPNKLDVRRNLTAQGLKQLEENLGPLLYKAHLRMRTSISEAITHGESVPRFAPGSHGSKMIDAFCTETLNRIDGQKERAAQQ